MLLKGSGLGRVRFAWWWVVRVPEDDTDYASRGRPFVCVELNVRRPTEEGLRVIEGLGVRAG